MQTVYLLTTIFAYLSVVSGLPLNKRLYRPSSGVFSIIAHHEGKEFQYNLLKWDGSDLLLNADEQAFFGRVRASQGYILNLPYYDENSNYSTIEEQSVANTDNVHVDPQTYKLTTSKNATDATRGFGILDQTLTYRNSSGFLACPDSSTDDEYHVYWGNNNRTVCPRNASGYNIELIVQTDAYVNYNPESNVRTNFTALVEKKRKRFFWV